MGRKKDRFWDYAEKLKEKDGFKCNFCHDEFCGSISRIKPHLAQVPGQDIRICTRVPESVRKIALEELGGPNKKAKGAPSTTDFEKKKITSASSSSPSNTLHHSITLESCNNKANSAVDKLLAQHVVLNNIPIDVIQTEVFSRFVQGVAEYGPGYRLPSVSTLKTNLIPDLRMEVDDYVANVKNSWVTTGCTLMLDLWGDKKQGDFFSIIAYSPKGAVFMKLFDIPNERTEELNLAVSSVIEEIGPNNVVQFITNARKFESVGGELVLNHPWMYKTRCAAHGIRLLMKHIYEEVDWVKKVIDDAYLIVKYMHKNTVISSLMREHTNNKELKCPCMTRFASNFLMLKSIVEVEIELQSLVASSKWRELDCNKEDMAKTFTSIVESTDFWSQGKEVLEVLRSLVRVLQLAESDGSTIGYLYEAMERAEGEIKQLCCINKVKYMRILELFEELESFEESNTRNIMHPIHAAAAFLNPAYMRSENFREDQKMRDGIGFILENLVADEEKDDFIGEVQIYRIKESSLFTDMAIRMLRTSHPRTWWDFNGNTLPTLKKYAIRILSQPCSSSSCQRNWSAFEAVKTKKRNRLAPELLENLVYVRMNIMMMEKFKKLEAQGTKPIDLDKLSELPECVDHEQDWEDVDEGFDDDVMNDADQSRLDENSFYQMENIGQYCVSAILQQLLNKLTSPELQEFVRHEQIRTELCKWNDILRKIYAVLDDAEEKQMENSKLKIWLSKLTDLAYDMEDVLDEIGTEALRHKLMVEPQAGSSNIQTLIPERHQLMAEILAYGEEDILEEMGTEDIGIVALRHQLMVKAHASTSNVQTLIPTSSSGLNPSTPKMRCQIDEITSRLREIVTQIDNLNLREKAGRRTNKLRGRPPAASLVDKSLVYGREKDKDSILELVLKDEGSDDLVCVIPIIGMGGVGKTTLAQLVYNDGKVNDCFDLKAWVYVSKEFNIHRILGTIFLAVTSEIDEDMDLDDLNSLQMSLGVQLHGKKFLIVLDGVWKESCYQWYALCRSFKEGAVGSKIVVTTRDESVASTMGSFSSYLLKELSFDDCLSLFAHHALGTESFDGHLNLKVISEKIVRRCKGLPLAVKILGGLLHSKLNCDDWEDILNSKIWDFPGERSGIFPALILSYHHLPFYLKRCFAYCAIFPKGYEFDKDELVLLWMAEGFLQELEGKKHMEDLGHEYFLELLSRSFFQQSSGNKSRFVMHDLINDLAKSVAGEICFNLEDDTFDKSVKKIRYSSFHPRPYDVSQRFEDFHRMKGLRTFFVLPFLVPGFHRTFPSKVSHDLIPKLRYLRELSLAGYEIIEIPDSIGDLKHLRYLNFSYSPIEELPESMSALLNLQTLILRGCSELTMLPEGIGNLIELHYLDIIGTDDLREIPSGIANLTNLQTLSKFIVGKGDGGLRVKDLKNLSHLRGQLSILNLHNVVYTRDAWDANLKEKEGLDDLVLGWRGDGDESGIRLHIFPDSSNERDKEMQVLDWLQPHRNLKKLTIASYGGIIFPTWIGDPSFSNLVQLNLRNCTSSTSLPSLGGLPFLKDLIVECMEAVRTVGPEFYGSTSVKAFPSLESLIFKDMWQWETWFSTDEVERYVFPCLRKLVIQNCPKLNGLLRVEVDDCLSVEYFGSFMSLPSLHELEIEKCDVAVLTSLVDLISLTTLKICAISGLASLDILPQLVALEVMEIKDCSELIYLWEAGANLARLKKLVVKSCSQLVSLVGEEGGLLPCSLEELGLESCDKLEKLPNGLHSLTCLRSLSIRWCPKLVSFPATGLPYTLKRLELDSCEALVFWPDHGMTIHGGNSNQCFLEELVISFCPSLKSFPRGMLPTTLKKLNISYCRNLESLPEGMMLDDNNSNNTSHLKSLVIEGCDNLKSLPNQMHNFTSLQKLDIQICKGIVSFPEGGLPPNLTSLVIERCVNMKQSMSEWGLHRLSSLRQLRLVYSCPTDMVSFPDDDCSMLPITLTDIHICGLENLKSISRGIKNLTSLEKLEIWSCPNLHSLPKEGLPASLRYLEIWCCPLLRERCLKEGGVYWPIISHIPCVKIDHEIQ